MTQRIFVTCPLDHDIIAVGHLACQKRLGREYRPGKDYLRWLEKRTKYYILIDCDYGEHYSYLDLTCYHATSTGGQM